MNPLIKELNASGLLNEAMVEWALAHQAEHGMPLDSALLDLDLVDEDGLLCGLESCFGMTAARPNDLTRVDPGLGKILPEGFSQSFTLCPLSISGNEIVVLVESPLSEESVEDLRSLFGLEPRPLVAPSHYMALAKEKVYSIPIDESTRELEAKLSRRRGAADIQYVLASVSHAATLSSAVADVLDFAACLLDFSCFLVYRKDELRVVAVRGGGQAPGESLELPEMGCSLGAAIRYGGYFVGPIRGTMADKRFYRALGRPLPRWSFISPVPTAGNARVLFLADNGPRGIATRWVAEITLLTSRLGQRGGDRKASRREESSVASVEEAFQLLTGRQAEEQLPARSARTEVQGRLDEQDATPLIAPGEAPAPVAAEQAAIDRLRHAAAAAGMPLDSFVDDLLRDRGIRPAPEDTTALVSEVKGLFEKLATDIPAQLARGMETAFRAMVPRLASGQPPALSPTAPSPPASVGLVRKEDAGPREVPSYRSRRCKTKRIKL